MRAFIIGISAAVLFAAAASAQTLPGKPDFSGIWMMDKSRSESAAQEQPVGVVRLAITQTGSSLAVETDRDGKTETIVYPIDVEPNGRAEMRGLRRAFWDGPALINEGSVDIRGQTIAFREVRMPAADGAEMVVETTLKVEHGYEMRGAQTVVTGKNVYIRSR
ncbi:MAG: hypothetical protein V4601_03850 [Pseudomonadota bacterium]